MFFPHILRYSPHRHMLPCTLLNTQGRLCRYPEFSPYALFSSPVLSLVNYSHLALPRGSSQLPKLRECPGFCTMHRTFLKAINWDKCKALLACFPSFRLSLFFVVWCSVSWKLFFRAVRILCMIAKTFVQTHRMNNTKSES